MRIKPPALRAGDTVGVIAPASPIDPKLLEAGCEALQRMGYRTFYLPSICDKELYFAGPIERRAREFEEMFLRDEVRCVLCARGGYGSNYLLTQVDWNRIALHPKIFVGYSDITTSLLHISDQVGWTTFHGPMLTKDFTRDDGVDISSWNAALSGESEWSVSSETAVAVAEGAGEGILYGGCLSMLAASLGTPYEVRTEGTILFLEDVATKPFQIDRMLMQLNLAGKFSEVRGIIFGEMQDCVQSPDQGYSLADVARRVLAELKIPIAFGLRSGHVSRNNITLPIGVRARLTVRKSVELRILEAATTAAHGVIAQTRS